MANATDQQVQAYVNNRVRPRCEQILALINSCAQDTALIDDVFAALTQPSPTWVDNRQDGPPHLLAPSDVLAWNTWIVAFSKFAAGTATAQDVANAFAQLPIIKKSVVQ